MSESVMTPEQESKIARAAVEWMDAQLGVGVSPSFKEWRAVSEFTWAVFLDAYKGIRQELGHPKLPEAFKDNAGLPKPRDARPTLT